MTDPQITQALIIAAYAVLAAFGSAFGLILADADQNVPFIKHRSMFTHGVLWPILAYFVSKGVNDQPFILAALFGFLAGYAIHLLFDMFPQSWHGIALIHLFGSYRMWPTVSFLWLFAGVEASIWVLSQWAGDWRIAGAALAACFVYKSKYEHKLIMPLLSLVVIFCIPLYLGA